MAAMEQIVQGPGERHLIYGGTRTGKSSLMDWSIRHIQRTRPGAMILIADTKPRFRAQHLVSPRFKSRRKSTREMKTYATWTSGPELPNSVRVDLDSVHPFRGLWDQKEHPGEVAIMQSDEASDWRTMNELMHEFVHTQRSGRERLIVVDEGLDFYQRNTLGIDARKDVILRTARAGGERNVGLMLGAHRPHGIPPLLNTLSSRITLFHLRYKQDMKYLYEMGVDPEIDSPDGKYIFSQFTIEPGGKVSEPLTGTMKYPDSYLKQLSAT